ncbi:hypothetical protein [Nitratidesulfovibrio liaohensis]|uniref:PD-(D/E)XK nuclease superfamily protein n=1 Tax=Nitratidesulfovibrio liaohensis TaxID=2604158 RepID=A0ABY9R0W7_9BACT|nr:hypothetical protein [Nitratidesulfovibrio liaohensis]WMW64653.1 hypothetical protein KPS_002706 [Nitratidesulfovibrio liaohensis]
MTDTSQSPMPPALPAPLCLLAESLLTREAHTTQSQLGDRSTYVGMSDIGAAMECLRSAAARKLASPGTQPHTIPPQHVGSILKRHLPLHRGHWQEAGITDALTKSGHRLIPQLEISASFHGVPIKAHLDITLIHEAPTPVIRVLELKSNGHLPETLYTSNEVQLYGQIGLLEGTWHRPCCSLRDEDGQPVFTRKTFPEAARLLFGIYLPSTPEGVTIEGWVLSISMADAKAFGPYTPNRTMLGICCNTAADLWQAVNAVKAGQLALDDLPYCRGFHPLCDWCDANATCPKFRPMRVDGMPVDLGPAHATDLDHLASLKERKLAIEGDIAVIEGRIRSAFQRIAAVSDSMARDWITAGRHRFRVASMPGRQTIDQSALQEELEALTGDPQTTTDILDRARKTGQPHERLFISPINGKGE